MSLIATCPGCQATLRVREEYAGRQIQCPRCQGSVTVPAAAPDEVILTVEPDPHRQSGPPLQPDLSAAVGEGMPVALPPRQPDPRATPGYGPRGGERRGPPQRRSWRPCPRCNSDGAERVDWTPWGSFYGPSLLSHVRCPACGYAYNGKSGRSNLVGICLFSLIPFLLLVGLNVGMWLAFGRMVPLLMWVLIGVQGVVVLVMVILGLVGGLKGGHGGQRPPGERGASAP